MAVADRFSGPITDRDASPRTKVDAAVMGGTEKFCVGTLETVSGDDIASTYRFFEIPSNAVMSDLKIYSDDNGTTAAGNIGLYQTTDNGSAVVDADFFASALNIAGGALNGTDVLHESAIFGLEDAEKPVWEALGLSADPNLKYDVVMTLTAASDAAATITLKGRYTY